MLKRGLPIVGAIALGLLQPSDASACSCMAPQIAIVGPDRVSDAPLNTRVRFVVPVQTAPAATAVVRVSDTSARADVTERRWVDGTQIFVELTPAKPLGPDTRYEVALVSSDPSAYPSTTVLGTFKTGTSADTTPPKLDSVGAAVAKGNLRAGGGDCTIQGPWIEVANVSASDPGRPAARLMYGVWAADAAGNLDTTKPPAALVSKYLDTLTVGKRSLCDPHDFPISMSAPSMTIAIAAVDEAGNMSPPRRLPKISLTGIGAHP